MVALIGASILLFWLDSSNISKFILVVLVAGYIVGNRGFAQFTPVPGIPLLPGEGALALLAALTFIEQSRGGLRGWQWRGLDLLIVAWIALGLGRMFFDGRTYGILALRDFAMVYYAAFYFAAKIVTQRGEQTASVLLATVRVSAIPMGVLFMVSQQFPGIFLHNFNFRGVPLIFYKDDLVGLYAAIAAVLHFLRYEERRRIYSLVFCFCLVALVISTSNRAAMIALFTMACWVVYSGRWRLAAWLGVGGVVGAVAVLTVAQVRNESWETTPLFGLYEAVNSLADPTGQGTYRGEETSIKGDNNLFRWVWWKILISDTWSNAPVFGLGFGYDLAAQFEREYFAGAANDFTARSPHSIFVTVFARMGIAGLVLFLSIVAWMFHFTAKAARVDHPHLIGAWAGAWAILASASFGVVMEGPMGAVIFWVLLGIASAMSEVHDRKIAGDESDGTS
ncbi:MAG: hypothetical protein SynsKO_22780 [Synoicihabitans sp.]